MDARRWLGPLACTLLIAVLGVTLTPGCRLATREWWLGDDRASDGSGDPIAEWRERWAPELAPPTAPGPDASAAESAAVAALQHLGSGDEPGAREILDRAAQEHAQDTAALARLAEVYLEIDPARGQELLRAAIDLDRLNAEHRLALAASLEETGQSEAALAELKAGVEAIPNSRELRLAYATALIRAGDGRTAEETLSSRYVHLWDGAIIEGGDEVVGKVWSRLRSAAPVSESELAEGRRLLDELLQELAQRHRLLASAAILQGDLARAAAEYQLSVEARRNWAAQLRLADLRVALGEEQAAKEAYLGIAPRQARLARARLERWDAVGFEAFSAEMKRFITEHAQEYTTINTPPEWSVPDD